MAVRTWRCRKVTKGVACATLNLRVKQKCTACGGPRPKRKQKHSAVLDLPYEWWVEQFGERCNICGAKPSEDRRLDRDHCHRTGQARGLLCHFCNRRLGNRRDSHWLRKALEYMERAEHRAFIAEQAAAEGREAA